MNEPQDTITQTITMDGHLKEAEALAALSAASLAATAALPDALLKCKTRAQMQKVLAARDTCQLAYTNSLARSLKHTGPMFEQVAKDLEKAAKDINKKSKNLKNVTQAVKLLSDAVRLAGTLALAFA